jgi:hypothetical protein
MTFLAEKDKIPGLLKRKKIRVFQGALGVKLESKKSEVQTQVKKNILDILA